jgi:hypothetical protein
MLSPSNLKLRILVLSLLAVVILLPAAGFAEAPSPATLERGIDQSQTPEPAGELLQADELERLQALDEQPPTDVAGGALSNEHLSYIVIALAAAVLVLVLK